ncbi:MAG: hypothetical protein JXX14_02585 [Deltaproteobacteria bacterium]|nr:hypothetical protein [Deltaproteobacteria bacterium]
MAKIFVGYIADPGESSEEIPSRRKSGVDNVVWHLGCDRIWGLTSWMRTSFVMLMQTHVAKVCFSIARGCAFIDEYETKTFSLAMEKCW